MTETTIGEYVKLSSNTDIATLKLKYAELRKFVEHNKDTRLKTSNILLKELNIFRKIATKENVQDVELINWLIDKNLSKENYILLNGITALIYHQTSIPKTSIFYRIKQWYSIHSEQNGFENISRAIDDAINPTQIHKALETNLTKLKEQVYKSENNKEVSEEELIRFMKSSFEPKDESILKSLFESKDASIDDLRFIFWRYIDLVILEADLKSNKVYSFMNFRFPNFIGSSFVALFNEDNVIKTQKEKELNFLFTHFIGEVSIKKAIFEGKVSFNLSTFHKKSAITQCRFEHEVFFRKTVFHNDIDFEASYFTNIKLNDIQFPKNRLYKIKMERLTLEKAIWTEFNNPKNINQIEANRETFSTFKQANAGIGNFIDSNLFFVRESEVYRKEAWKNFRGKGQERDSSYQWSVLPDVISFGLAKWTSNYGTSWIRPIIGLLILFVLSFIWFTPNENYFATPNTPSYAVDIKETNKTREGYIAKLTNNFDYKGKAVVNERNETIIEASATDSLQKKYFEEKYFENMNYDFQKENKIKLKGGYLTQWSFYLSCIVPTFLPIEQQYVIKSENEWIYYARLLYSIFMWYFITAFGFAIQNRTRRS